ncbi:uncharacterized protein PAC_08342 [Phialocephala subalpina]|uniref:C2H2-type domain-containing protein n=1 Tax=Phialocephala subalpina TaxID=576137 RepID=A0A1L7X0B2_9HELO|nr:uncharacterized protein PAC_08342 [Phialocephala subalpina]
MHTHDATELRSSPAANALFPECHFLPVSTLDSPALYLDSIQLSQEREVWLENTNNTTTTVSSVSSYDAAFLQDQNEFLLHRTGSWDTIPAFEAWTVPNTTPLNCPIIDLGHNLTLPWNQYSWDYPSISYGIARSVSSTSREFRCDWPQCSKLEFTTAEEHKLHTKFHAREVRNRWQPSSPNNKCTWHSCTSQARLKTSKLFEDHISNIHINPLICTRDGCKHKTPFRGKADLQRHIDSVHNNVPKIRCPYEACSLSDEKSFCRKDKLICHLRKVHDTDPCPYDHSANCLISSTEFCESTARHIGKVHGEYECALKSCEGTRSQFSEEGLLEHLQLGHDIRWEMVLKIRDVVKKVDGRVLRDGHLRGKYEIPDCTSCARQWPRQ